MIQLRSAIDRALERRWLGLLIILVLALLLVFVVFHTTIDAAHDEGGLTCLALAAAIALLLLRARAGTTTESAPKPFRRRGPPASFAPALHPVAPRATSPPLRL